MEGSSYNKNVVNYKILSKYYDALLQDEDSFYLWLKYIEEKKFNNCLELGSGTALFASKLYEKGYGIIASDISCDMLEASKINFKGEYLILNMIDFKLDNKFDLIFSIVDTINYLELSEIEKSFNCIYKHLNKSGRFIFDMHHIKRLEEFKEEYIEEDIIDDLPYQWTILADIYEKRINQCFTFYHKDGIIQEHHTQNVFMIDDIKNIMLNIGFKVRIIEDFIKDEKVLIIGEK